MWVPGSNASSFLNEIYLTENNKDKNELISITINVLTHPSDGPEVGSKCSESFSDAWKIKVMR